MSYQSQLDAARSEVAFDPDDNAVRFPLIGKALPDGTYLYELVTDLGYEQLPCGITSVEWLGIVYTFCQIVNHAARETTKQVIEDSGCNYLEVSRIIRECLFKAKECPFFYALGCTELLYFCTSDDKQGLKKNIITAMLPLDYRTLSPASYNNSFYGVPRIDVLSKVDYSFCFRKDGQQCKRGGPPFEFVETPADYYNLLDTGKNVLPIIRLPLHRFRHKLQTVLKDSQNADNC